LNLSFHRILIANRGEIAVRIARACRALGIESVAVYSDFDRDALHVRVADLAVPIGPPPAGTSYLNPTAILEAARHTGADAIHPGYGFLAENPDFAGACERGSIAFIGPRSEVIRALGSKIEARKLAQEAGVAVVPGGSEQNSLQVGFPLLIKASAGGGGRGMRIVRSANEFQEALAAARSEAERAFGDGSLLIEKYVESARHVEIQIFGDHHGNLMHLGERDCSVQRRHQKIIEESPSPAGVMSSDLRWRMGVAALKLAQKLKYTNAGTVEFLLAPDGQFYFIEVNTRIQVEHPVTEMVTGLDLIRLQIEIAQGATLPAVSPQSTGHAIEARLYAEDPTNNFLPSTGVLRVWEPPQGMDGVRVDSGVQVGTEIGVYYDPLLAKIIAHGPDRKVAIRKLVYALQHCAAQGVETNREFLIQLLRHEEFGAARAHTGFQLLPQKHTQHDAVFAAIARSYIEHTEHARRAVLPSVPIRYQNNPYPSPPMNLEIGGQSIGDSKAKASSRLPVTRSRQDKVHESAGPPRDHGLQPIAILEITNDCVISVVNGIRHRFDISVHENTYYLRSSLGQRTVIRLPRYPQRPDSARRQTANSPMPGQVRRVLVAQGQPVKIGDPLIVLEAMKMEQTITATVDGLVSAILVNPGDLVTPGQKLIEIEGLENAHECTDSSAASD
jgi:acetyl/propionyl-CoA carboxylase alpha subunit